MRCGKTFKRPCDLARHKKRKTPCETILSGALPGREHEAPSPSLVCKFCGRVFAKAANRSRHEKDNCKITRSEDGMEQLYAHVKRLQEESANSQELQKQLAESQRMLAESQKQVAELALLVRESVSGVEGPPRGRGSNNQIRAGAGAAVNQIQQLQVEMTNNICNQVNNEIQVSNKITVNVFGHEHVETADHITASQIYGLLMNAKEASDPATQALLDTALVVFSNPEKPENLTCYLAGTANKKTSEALVHEATGWQIKSIETVLSPIVTK